MDLRAFMVEPVSGETKEVYISNRFKGADGKPVPFKIRAIDQETNDRLMRQCTTRKIVNGVSVQDINTEKLTRLIIVECTVEPNFRATELCDYYKTADPLEVPGRMLSVGEYNKLSRAIQELNGVLDTAESAELIEQAKNL